MRIKSLMIYTLLLLFAVNCSQAQLTLSTAVNKAISANKGIKSYQKSFEAKQEQVSVSWGRYMPSVSLDAFYNYIDKDVAIDLNPIRSAMIQLQSGNSVNFANLEALLKTGTPLTDQEKAQILAGAKAQLEKAMPEEKFKEILKERAFPQALISLKQPIFTGGKITAGVDAANAQKDMAETKVNTETESLINNVIANYLNVLLAKENLRVRTEVLEGIKKHADRAEKLLLQGVIANNDKLRADVALAEADRNEYEAKEKLNLAYLALKSVLESNDENIELSESLKYAESNLNIDNLILAAKDNNPILNNLRASTKALNAKADSKYADYFPTIFGYGFYNVFDHYIAAEEPKWGIGVGMHYELFDGMMRTNEYQSSKAEAEAVNLMTQETERKIELLLRSQFMNYKIAQDQYNKLEKTLLQAEENYRLNEKRFEEGLGTSLEALDAQLALEGIKLKRVSALSDYYRNYADIYQTVGASNQFLKFWNENIK
jgi:outer membrane protein TolC